MAWLKGSFWLWLSCICKLFRKSWRHKDEGELGSEPQSSTQMPLPIYLHGFFCFLFFVFPSEKHVQMLSFKYCGWKKWSAHHQPPSLFLHVTLTTAEVTARLSLFPLVREIIWWPGEWHGQGSPRCLRWPLPQRYGRLLSCRWRIPWSAAPPAERRVLGYVQAGEFPSPGTITKC